MATVNPTFRGPVRVFYHVVYSHGVLLHRLLSLSFLFTGHPRYRRFTVSDWLNWPVAQASRDCLINLTEQLPSQSVYSLRRPFNGHSPVWGNKSYNSRDQMVEDLFTEMDLCIVNDRSAACIHPHTGHFGTGSLHLCPISGLRIPPSLIGLLTSVDVKQQKLT